MSNKLGDRLTKKTSAEPTALPHFSPLPHLDMACLGGLLEHIAEDGGRDDIPLLAHLRNVEIMPVLDAAQMLGFAEIRQADVILTEAGRAFAEATIPERKVLFRTQLLTHVPLFAYISQALERAIDHELSIDFVLSVLPHNCPTEDESQQFMTVVEWGRNARLFAYNGHKATLHQL